MTFAEVKRFAELTSQVRAVTLPPWTPAYVREFFLLACKASDALSGATPAPEVPDKIESD